MRVSRRFAPSRRGGSPPPRSRQSRTSAQPQWSIAWRWFEQLERRQLLAANILNGFNGVDFVQTAGYVPPDTDVAVGPNYVVENVNTTIAIYDKTGGSHFSEDLTSFFSTIAQGNFMSDPFVTYDDEAGRFLVEAIDLTVDLNTGLPISGRLDFAVSDSSDPLAGFTEMHAIDLTGSTNFFPDFPRTGFNHDAYVFTVNMFTNDTETFGHVTAITVNKSTVTDANNATFSYATTNLPASSYSTLVPAAMHGSVAGDPEYLVEEALNSSGSPTGSLNVVKETGLTSTPVFSSTKISVGTYGAPPPADQEGSSDQIQTNDSRILSADWQGNELVATHTVGIGGVAQARWYQFDTSATPTLTEKGVINQGTGVATYYPSIAIAPNGDIGLTFMESSVNEYMSMYVTGRTPSDPTGTMQTPVLAAAGVLPYEDNSLELPPFRAGDFSGTAIDPADGTFWSANEVANSDTDPLDANWSTYIAHYSLPQVSVHDLSITALSVSSSVLVGSTQTVAVHLANHGTYSETFNVSLTDTPPTGGTAGTIAQVTNQPITLAPGGSTVASFTWDTTGATLGKHTLTATVTPTTSEQNIGTATLSKVVSVVAPLTDVALTGLSATPNPVVQGNAVTVKATIKNDGNQNISGAVVVTLEDVTTGATIGTQSVAGLKAGAGHTFSFSWQTVGAALERHVLSATVSAPGDQNAGNDTKTIAVTVEAAAPANVALLSTGNFTGLSYLDTAGDVPPDTDVAVGPTYVVETVNTTLAVYDKSGVKHFSEDLSQLFQPIIQGDTLSDPYVTYDDEAGRFLVEVIDLTTDPNTGLPLSDRLDFAVSDSSDPTQGFTEMHAIDLTGTSNYFADFPRTGFNHDAYVFTVNMFTVDTETFDHVIAITVDKSTVTDANNATFSYATTSLPGNGYSTLVPAAMHGSVAGDPEYLVEEAFNSSGNPSGAIKVVKETGLTSTPLFTATKLSVGSYSEPPPANQEGSTDQIQTNDSRILSVDWRANELVAAQTVGVGGVAQARWYQIDTSSTPTLTEKGTINQGAGVATYFPSIAIAPNGDLGMTFMESSPHEFMSMYVTARTPSDPLGLMEVPVLAAAGVQAYEDSSLELPPFRAGDFSGTAVDPIDGTFWSANEFADGDTNALDANWGTYISHFDIATPPAAVATPQVRSVEAFRAPAEMSRANGSGFAIHPAIADTIFGAADDLRRSGFPA